MHQNSVLKKTLTALSLTAFVGGLAACGGSNNTADGTSTVTVYTGRHYGIETVFEEFTAETGIEVRFTTGSDPELRERLEIGRAHV